LEVAKAAADHHRVPRLLVIVLLLQESQWYHGTRTERLWTEVFLMLRRAPLRRLRAKSFGVASIKPLTAQRELVKTGESSISLDEAARRAARRHESSIDMATSILGDFLARGASAEGAFLAYAASTDAADLAVAEPSRLVSENPRFEKRLRDYAEHIPTARRLEGAPSAD